MKRTKTIMIGLVTLLITGLAASCSQDVVEELKTVETQQTTTVKDLTAQLIAYNASTYGTTRTTVGPWIDNPADNTKVKMNVVVADVKGAIRGFFRGGWKGALVGAAASSIIQMGKNRLFPTLMSTVKNPKVFAANGDVAPTDSLGYYHNMLELMIHSSYPSCHNMPSGMLISKANETMNHISLGYSTTYKLANNQITAIHNDINAYRDIDINSISFDSYCDELTQLNPEDKDYIDFVAEYLYVVCYANSVNIDEYTENVLFIINNANAADVDDISMLDKCVQIAYASSVLSKIN